MFVCILNDILCINNLIWHIEKKFNQSLIIKNINVIHFIITLKKWCNGWVDFFFKMLLKYNFIKFDI